MRAVATTDCVLREGHNNAAAKRTPSRVVICDDNNGTATSAEPKGVLNSVYPAREVREAKKAAAAPKSAPKKRGRKKKKKEVINDTVSEAACDDISVCSGTSSTDDEEYDIDKWRYLIGTTHRDDEDNLLYKTVSVFVDSEENIVATRALITDGVVGSVVDDTYFIQDIAAMTRDYDKSVTQTLKRKRDRYTYVVEKKVEWKDTSKLDDSNIIQ